MTAIRIESSKVNSTTKAKPAKKVAKHVVGVDQFAEFQSRVASAERFVRDHSHVGYAPHFEDYWDEHFQLAYEAISPHLRPIARRRMFVLPNYLPGRIGFDADTAHQALMFTLNPPEALFGFVKLFTSAEYLEIKRLVQQEVHWFAAQLKESPQSARKKAIDDEVRLELLLRRHHRREDGSTNQLPLDLKTIQRDLGWSQSRVSRAMKRLRPGGMLQYRKECRSRPRHGFLTRSADGMTMPDAFGAEIAESDE